MRAPIVALLILLLSTGKAAARTESARVHYDRGVAFYSGERYLEAVREFQAAYIQERRREYLFAWAQAARLSGDCVGAVALYRQYLALDLTAKQRSVTEERIAECGRRDPRSLQAAAEAESAPEAASLRATPKMEDRSPWYRDTWGNVLVGAGLVGFGVGATYLLLAHSTASDAAALRDYRGYERGIADAEGEQTIGWIGIAAGSALVGAGIVRYLLRDDRPAAAQAKSLSIQPGLGSVFVKGRF